MPMCLIRCREESANEVQRRAAIALQSGVVPLRIYAYPDGIDADDCQRRRPRTERFAMSWDGIVYMYAFT